MIKIIDYGLGNVQAFLTIFHSLDIKADRATNSESLKDATHLILPGVGAFDCSITLLNNSGMIAQLEELVLKKGIPILGVCVGMQMLATSSQEGKLPGLNWIPGEVKSFKEKIECTDLSTPHMGWNNVKPTNSSSLFSDNDLQSWEFYFLHSYYFHTSNENNIASTTKYGIEFCSSVQNNNIFGIQCHPEKSHLWGISYLKNFSRI